MYQDHFGLDQSPFGITPNPAFFYSGNTRGAILDALLYAVVHGEGIVKVTGEVGSGKTMLCRMLENRLPANVVVLYLVNPSLSPEEVLYTIAGELNLPTADKRSDEVLRLLHTDLIAKHAAGRQVVLLVEEAQAMPLDTLEEIRLLTNLETAHHKLLQIVLFGQPELDANLELASMRQLRERITHSFTVPPMEAEIIGEYLDFRLAAAGYAGPGLFDAAAVSLIALISKGIVRRINILADKALLSAFSDDAASVGAKHVRDAVRDSPFGQLPRRKPRQGLAIGLMLAVLLAAVGWQVLHLAPGALSATASLAAAIPAPGSKPTHAQPASPARLAQPGAATPASPPQPAAAARTATAEATPAPAVSLLQRSLDATTPWLAQEAEQHLVLQITMLPIAERQRIEQFLERTRDAIGLEQIHVYPLMVNGVPNIGIVYGSFDSQASAAAVQALLSDQSQYRPQILSIKTIRKEARTAASLGI